MDLKERFFLEVSHFAKGRDFIYEADVGCFVKQSSSDITHLIGLSISSGVHGDYIFPSLFLISNKIERTRKSISGQKLISRRHFTIIAHQHRLANYFEHPQYQVMGYLIKDEESLKTSLFNFKGFMSSVGFAFLTSFKSLSDFDSWLNDPVFNDSYDYRHGTVLNVAVEGLIAARLNNNARFEELYGIWIKKLSEDKRFANIIPILTSLKVSLDNLIDHPLV